MVVMALEIVFAFLRMKIYTRTSHACDVMLCYVTSNTKIMNQMDQSKQKKRNETKQISELENRRKGKQKKITNRIGLADNQRNGLFAKW